MSVTLTQIVSGGQTGVDRAGLDAAIFHEIPHGGWCPEGRRAEDGRIPDSYRLSETKSRNYAVRTRQNVIDSDGTLILFEAAMSRGTELTAKYAARYSRPLLTLDVVEFPDWSEERFETEVQNVLSWLESQNVNVLNIAGPRESSCPGIGGIARMFLLKLFESQVAAGS
ncbi:putative molybdenum carrier protein [Mariniblastus fucicola]|uniref:Molybdenum carrier n=1 Tax=Mariniblastus fucicola TaxID=980251 RepID=A0A5B9P7H0_9BACT|nr:putative molybdenum carrier protein [Mariniblastus fucicola]QEG21449.1 Putative molybdenum carrier [Mariniblastus fucicola]